MFLHLQYTNRGFVTKTMQIVELMSPQNNFMGIFTTKTNTKTKVKSWEKRNISFHNEWSSIIECLVAKNIYVRSVQQSRKLVIARPDRTHTYCENCLSFLFLFFCFPLSPGLHGSPYGMVPVKIASRILRFEMSPPFVSTKVQSEMNGVWVSCLCEFHKLCRPS